ncbi:3-hydroxyisobutyrate dehydrogenase-like beta-hydroxyacid dehydrogenase [Streptomyces sp. 1114.5]|uniref:DUF1932 domain-containing protein n=1 Tax=Streptomyces sp. 1114.5 TaxID=1938830 RepID=UPI000EABB2BF|nr:NAD(P)-dependent oxidoreductase [Streptomyces sp. 1114.5]RKT18161.1 3-hydroxyisobutyrate dehydrogenase-like beta-hydroxyacid dehydrogenase [Streptomyces sp. 1114.5]
MTIKPIVGILHPGSMGAAVAACARPNAARVLWCPAGRSVATVARAEQAGLEPVDNLDTLVKQAHVILSLCPPAAAEQLAHTVAERRYAGIYVEANAINPERMTRIAEVLSRSARAVVDGAVIGSPPINGKKTQMYLSGSFDAIPLVEGLFAGSAVATPVLGEEVGRASALKLAYSSYQKASRVLAAVAFGAARAHGVDDALLDVAGKRQGSYLVETGYIAKTAARAWRWGPEMDEAADMLSAVGLPDEMLRAVSQTLARWQDSKDLAELTPDEALDRLSRPQ